MSDIKQSPQLLEQLRLKLKEELLLDLDDYGLAEQASGEFNSTYLGVRLNSAFQPIYHIKAGDLFGHEALIRPSLGGELLSTPEFAFSYAEQAGKLVPFDRVCRTLHVLNFKKIYAENGLLFLNVHPKLLISVNAHGKVFEKILHSHAVPTDRIVIEIQESLIEQDKQLTDAILNYQDKGYRIAIDRFGNTQSHINRLWDLAIDFVKLDSNLIQRSEHDARLRRALPRLVKLIKEVGADVVITGIETQTQLDIAIESGADLVQGFFLAKPMHAYELQTNFPFKGGRSVVTVA